MPIRFLISNLKELGFPPVLTHMVTENMSYVNVLYVKEHFIYDILVDHFFSQLFVHCCSFLFTGISIMCLSVLIYMYYLKHFVINDFWLFLLIGFDPCTTNAVLAHQERRCPSVQITQFGLCDKFITEGWYRVNDDSDIPTSCPRPFQCDTQYPVWMPG